MFNYHQYQKRLDLSQSLEKKEEEETKRDKQKHVKQDKLCKNYGIRVQTFIHKMDQNPITLNEYRNPSPTFRDVNHFKDLGDPQMYVNGFKNEKQRIATSLKQNLIFDASPLDNHSENFSFRERNHSKEIQPELRFQPRTSIDRVKQYFYDYKCMQLENKLGFDVKHKSCYQKITDSIKPIEKKKQQYISKETKIKRSYLRSETFISFSTLKNLFLSCSKFFKQFTQYQIDLKVVFCSKSGSDFSKADCDYIQSSDKNSFQLNKEKMKELDNSGIQQWNGDNKLNELIETSKSILEKCKYQKQKSPKAITQQSPYNTSTKMKLNSKFESTCPSSMKFNH